MTKAAKVAGTGLQAHLLSAWLNPAQSRLDIWNRLREGISRLSARQAAGEDTDGLEEELRGLFRQVHPLERLFVFPGEARLMGLMEAARRRDVEMLEEEIRRLVALLSQHGDRAVLVDGDGTRPGSDGTFGPDGPHYFTVLLADDLSPEVFARLQREVREAQAGESQFVYELLHVSSLEDALVAALFNNEVQACVIRQDLPVRSAHPVEELRPALEPVLAAAEKGDEERGVVLARWLRDMRPQLDLYLVTDESLASRDMHTSRLFNRVFYRYESSHELNVTVVDGVRERYRAPFFDALRHYAARPIGNFHALPIARGHSVFNSRWLRDMGEFYGPNLFMAESSSTSGGLDSLLEPTGSIREAQEKAARTFGAERTFFVTNGTSTANKIVHQTLLEPGDVVLIDRNCHKSHHYGLVLAGAQPVYLDAYPLQPYAIYGGVPLRTLKQKLLELKAAGRLDKVKLVVLTNCTFDGLVYHPLRVMEELLAIKPDLAFLWDEAWFAYAGFVPLARQRTAMAGARQLATHLRGSAYREEYRAWKARRGNGSLSPERDLDERLLPDPDKVRVRVYSTQSTHKSLSAFRQGSMIHVWDEAFERRAAEPFREAFFTHITTSPNHQLVASLDLARRQVDLEGFAMVKEAYQLALRLRERLREDPALHRYLRLLDVDQMVPREFRASKLERYVGEGAGDVGALTRAWAEDEFVLDPTRLTLYTALTGNNGFEFRGRVLMGQLGIQVNHTSINTVLMNATIGVTWGSLSFLLDGLKQEVRRLESWLAQASAAERRLFDGRVRAITEEGLPPLPDFSGFHQAFQPSGGVGEGDLRSAFFQAYREENCEYVPIAEADELLRAGRSLVSTRFVVPYPPGFPILVPGQVVSPGILEFMRKLDVKEVHGYRHELGLRVFSEEALERVARPEEPRPTSRRRGLEHEPVPAPH